MLAFHVQSPKAPPHGMCCAAVKGRDDHQAWPGRTSHIGPGASQASGDPKKTVCMGVSGSVQEQTTHMSVYTQTHHTCVHTCIHVHIAEHLYADKCTCAHRDTNISTHNCTHTRTCGASGRWINVWRCWRTGAMNCVFTDRGEESISSRTGGPV